MKYKQLSIYVCIVFGINFDLREKEFQSTGEIHSETFIVKNLYLKLVYKEDELLIFS